MKNSKKIVTAMLTGTLAFSSIGVAPMMAFASEISAEDQTFSIVDGVAQSDDEALEAQSFGTRNVSMVFMSPYTANVPRYYYNNTNRNQVRNVWVGDVRYPNTVAAYTPYNGRMNVNWYGTYAKNILGEVKTAINQEKLSEAEKAAAIAKVNAAIASIDAATSYNAINGYLDGVYGYVTGCPWNSRINWGNYFTTDKYGRWRKDCYLPYDWDWRWDCGRYDCSYTPSDAAKSANVYRLVNGKGVHVYVNSTAKCNEFVAAGWEKEGKCFNSLATSSKPVYQLFNDANVYTYALTAEAYEALASKGWHKDGVAFYASDSGTKVYAFENRANGSVLFTKSAAEYKELLANKAWMENGCFFVK